MTTKKRTPGQRAGLSRDAVVTAARELLAESSLDGLTMRALADRLGVAPNTLYSHVDNKTALIDDVLDEVLALVTEPPADASPAAGLHLLMSSTYQVLIAHPDLVPLYLARQGARGENAQRLGRTLDALLARAGVAGEAANEARRALIVFTIGYASFGSQAPDQPTSEHPLSARQLSTNFATGLDWLLTGITAGAPVKRRRSVVPR